MKAKKFIFGVIASAISMWILAGLYHEIAAAAFYSEEAHASHEGTAIILIGYIILGLLMVALYPYFTVKKKPWLRGLLFGTLIGLLWVFPHDIVMAGAHETSIWYAIRNGAWHMIEQGAGGVVIGLVVKD